MGIIALLTLVITLNFFGSHPFLIAAGLVVCGIAGIGFASNDASKITASKVRSGRRKIGAALGWCLQRLDPDNYLPTWWHEAALLAFGIAVFSISVHFLRIHQHADFKEIWHVMHLRVRLGDYPATTWEMALFGGGFLAAMFAYIRLSQRLADAFWCWRYERRVAA